MGVSGDLLIVAELSGLVLVSYAAVWHYRSPDLTPWPIALLVFGTWYLGFMGTLLLPIDLSACPWMEGLDASSHTACADSSSARWSPSSRSPSQTSMGVCW